MKLSRAFVVASLACYWVFLGYAEAQPKGQDMYQMQEPIDGRKPPPLLQKRNRAEPNSMNYILPPQKMQKLRRSAWDWGRPQESNMLYMDADVPDLFLRSRTHVSEKHGETDSSLDEASPTKNSQYVNSRNSHIVDEAFGFGPLDASDIREFLDSEYDSDVATHEHSTQNVRVEETGDSPSIHPNMCHRLGATASSIGDLDLAQFDAFLKYCQPSQNFLRFALTIAHANANRELVLMLLRHGTNPQGVSTQQNMPLLHYAVEIVDIQMVHALLRAGADIQENYSFSPLSRAVKHCDIQLIQLLLNFGARVDVKDRLGLSPFDMALGCPNADEIQSLLSTSSETEISAGSHSPQRSPQHRQWKFISDSPRDLEPQRLSVAQNAEVTNSRASGEMPTSYGGRVNEIASDNTETDDWRVLGHFLEDVSQILSP